MWDHSHVIRTRAAGEGDGEVVSSDVVDGEWSKGCAGQGIGRIVQEVCAESIDDSVADRGAVLNGVRVGEAIGGEPFGESGAVIAAGSGVGDADTPAGRVREVGIGFRTDENQGMGIAVRCRWPWKLVVISEAGDVRGIGCDQNDLVPVVVETLGKLAGYERGIHGWVSESEGFAAFHDEDALPRREVLDGGLGVELEENSVREGDAGEIEGGGAGVEEFDELEVLALIPAL